MISKGKAMKTYTKASENVSLLNFRVFCQTLFLDPKVACMGLFFLILNQTSVFEKLNYIIIYSSVFFTAILLAHLIGYLLKHCQYSLLHEHASFYFSRLFQPLPRIWLCDFLHFHSIPNSICLGFFQILITKLSLSFSFNCM